MASPLKPLPLLMAAVLSVTPLTTPPLAAQPAAGPASQSVGKAFTLSNGMRVLVKEDRRAPTVVHMVWYRAGSYDETNGTTGVAHVLEHMMFKGTRSLAPGEFSRRVAQLGGRENAFTNRDYTGYFQQVHKSRLPDVMALEADRMANLVVSKEEFDKEIRVVMEERRWRTDDRATSRVYEALMATAFSASPYRVPIIGWMNDLEAMTWTDARDWYERWYTPNNAWLVVAGDVDANEVLALAQKYYGGIASRPLPERKPQIEPPQRGAKRVEVKAPAENPYTIMAFHVPTLRDVEKDVDPYALEVLAAVLDGYENSRLTRHLVREQRIADRVGASYDMTQRGPALFMLDGTPAAGKTLADVERSLRQEIARIARDGIDPAELRRVKTQYVAGQVYALDSIYAQAMQLASLEVTGYRHDDAERILERIRAVTPEQVQSVAQRYFGDDTMTVATLAPQPVTDAPAARPPAGLRH